MFGFLIVLIVIAAILLIVIVIAQNPKGGGLAQGFQGGGQFMGVESTNKFLTNTTWGLVAFIVLASVLSAAAFTSDNGQDSVNEDVSRQAEAQQNTATTLPLSGQPQGQSAE